MQEAVVASAPGGKGLHAGPHTDRSMGFEEYFEAKTLCRKLELLSPYTTTSAPGGEGGHILVERANEEETDVLG